MEMDDARSALAIREHTLNKEEARRTAKQQELAKVESGGVPIPFWGPLFSRTIFTPSSSSFPEFPKANSPWWAEPGQITGQTFIPEEMPIRAGHLLWHYTCLLSPHLP
jgi:hypothetical protein